MDTQLIKRSCGGFTLIEILMVLILIALISMAMQSNFGKLKVTDGDIERERLLMIARIVHGRNEALLLNKDRSFSITQNGRAVQYDELTPLTADSYGTDSNAQSGIATLKAVKVTAGKSSDSSSATSQSDIIKLTFKKDGTYSGESSLTFSSTDSGSKIQPVTISISGAGYVE